MKLQSFHDQSSGERGSFGTVCHIPMCPAFCDRTREVLIGACKELGLEVHDKGTMVTVEGPRFSSLAESKAFRSWGCDVVNMTTVPEVGSRLSSILYRGVPKYPIERLPLASPCMQLIGATLPGARYKCTSLCLEKKFQKSIISLAWR